MVRINIEVTDEQRRKLKSKLALEGLTIKEWLIKRVDEYIKKEGKPKSKKKGGETHV